MIKTKDAITKETSGAKNIFEKHLFWQSSPEIKRHNTAQRSNINKGKEVQPGSTKAACNRAMFRV